MARTSESKDQERATTDQTELDRNRMLSSSRDPNLNDQTKLELRRALGTNVPYVPRTNWTWPPKATRPNLATHKSKGLETKPDFMSRAE